MNLFSFDNSEEIQNLNMKRIKKQTASEQVENRMHIKIDTGSEQALIPSINSTNSLNNKQLKDNEQSRIFDEENLLLKKKNSLIKIPPDILEVEMYFLERDSTKLEAERFFNHYESNGWLVGGKSKMKNWEAAARNWLINSKKFNNTSNSSSFANGVELKPNHLNATTNKSYRDEL